MVLRNSLLLTIFTNADMVQISESLQKLKLYLNKLLSIYQTSSLCFLKYYTLSMA